MRLFRQKNRNAVDPEGAPVISPPREGSMSRLADVLRQHAQLVAAGTSVSVALQQLIYEAALLAGSPPGLGLIRIVNPETLEIQEEIRGDGRVTRPNMPALADRGVIGRAMRTRQAQVLADVTSDRDFISVDEHVLSELAVPLLIGDRCLGALNLESTARAQFDPEVVPIIEVLASQAALTIELAGARQREADGQTEGSGGFTPEWLQAALRVIAFDALGTLADIHASVEVFALSGDGDALVTLAFATDNPTGVLPGRIAHDTSIAWQAIETGHIIEVSVIQESDARASIADSRCALVLPLRNTRNETVGVLNVEAPTPHALDGTLPNLDVFRQRAEIALRDAGDQARTTAASLSTAIKEIREEILALVDPDALGRLYQLVLHAAVQMVGRPNLKAAIALLDDGSGTEMMPPGPPRQLTITPERTYNYTDEMRRVWSWTTDRGLTGIAINQRRSVLVPDVQAPGVNYLPQDPTTHCELVVPLLRDEKPLGIIDIISPEINAITLKHQEAIEALAAEVVQALDRADKIRRGLVAQSRLRVIYETNQLADEMLSQPSFSGMRESRKRALEALLAAAMEATGSVVGEIVGAIRIPEGPSRAAPEEDAEMVLLNVYPEPQGIDLTVHFPAQRGITGEVYRSRRPVKAENVKDYPDFVPMPGFSVASELAVPILGGDHVLGVLNVDSEQPRMYSPEQIATVELLASQAASIISAADLIILRRQMDELYQVERQVMVMSVHDDGDPINKDLQQNILRAALRLTEAEDGYASFWLAHGNALRRHQFYTPNEASLGDGATEVTHQGLVGLIRATQSPLLIVDATEPRWQHLLLRTWLPVKSALGVPLLDPDRAPDDPARVLGVLNVESPNKLGFTHRDIEILELLAQASVVALRNRELYRGKVALLRDITHAFEKAIWPLSGATHTVQQELARQPVAVSEEYRGRIRDIAEYADMAGNLLGWFQQLVLYQGGGKAPELGPTPIVRLVQRMVSRMDLFARDAEKSLEFLPPAEFSVNCSEELIQAVLFLLIENALRYGPEHDRILIRLTELAEGGARIEVIDHGAAVPADERAYLFEPGFRGRDAIAKTAASRGSNAGLGLDQVRRVVEVLHHGQVTYEARPDGNVFTIRLP